MRDVFPRFARAFNGFTASPIATGLAFALVLLWAVTGPRFHFSDTWQLVMNTTSSIVTFLMVFIIANAQKRDTDALNLKLDMLIAANPQLSNRAIGIEAAPEEHAAAVRAELEEVMESAADRQKRSRRG